MMNWPAKNELNAKDTRQERSQRYAAVKHSLWWQSALPLRRIVHERSGNVTHAADSSPARLQSARRCFIVRSRRGRFASSRRESGLR